jgi:hypothetical protein
MKRVLLTGLLVALLAGGYYVHDYVFDSASETRTGRPPPAQLVVGDVAAQMPTPILVNAIGNVQSIAAVMVKSRIDGENCQRQFCGGAGGQRGRYSIHVG